MIIIYGTRFYGKIDAVPGLFHVATRFFHLFWVPLIPLGSSIVIENSGHYTLSGEQVLVHRIPLRWRSIFLTYARIVLWVLLAVVAGVLLNSVQAAAGQLGLVPMPAGFRHAPDATSVVLALPIVFLGVVTIVGALLRWSYSSARASRSHALAMGQAIGFPDELVLKHLRAKGGIIFRPRANFRVRLCKNCGTAVRVPPAAKDDVPCERCGTLVPAPMGLRGYFLMWALILFGILTVVSLVGAAFFDK